MPSAGFEPAILVIKQPQNFALDHTATGICNIKVIFPTVF
jgi:hypothetical protein